MNRPIDLLFGAMAAVFISGAFVIGLSMVANAFGEVMPVAFVALIFAVVLIIGGNIALAILSFRSKGDAYWRTIAPLTLCIVMLSFATLKASDSAFALMTLFVCFTASFAIGFKLLRRLQLFGAWLPVLLIVVAGVAGELPRVEPSQGGMPYILGVVAGLMIGFWKAHRQLPTP